MKIHLNICFTRSIFLKVLDVYLKFCYYILFFLIQLNSVHYVKWEKSTFVFLYNNY